MHPLVDPQRLAVCSWSLQPATPAALVRDLETIGIPRVQIALDLFREKPDVWKALPILFQQNGIELVSGMFGTAGEDYSTMDSIRRTGGLVPDQTWEANWKNLQIIVEVARQLGLRLVTFHAGFLPHEPRDARYQTLSDRIRRVAALFGREGIDLGFETGQETAPMLRAFLEHLNLPNIGVNFDPANMILYDKGDPIEALRMLAPWLKQCHIKDARKTKQPGTWGDEVVVGTGEVDWQAFARALEDLKFKGFCAVEREAGDQRVADIRAARQFMASEA